MAFWIANLGWIGGRLSLWFYAHGLFGRGNCSRALISESMAPNPLGQQTCCERWENGLRWWAPCRCTGRCWGDRLCPLALSLVLYIVVDRLATDSA